MYNITINKLKIMKKNIKAELDSFIIELNKSGFPYSYEILTAADIKKSKYEGIYGYSDMPNVEEIVIFKSSEHSETDNDFKFLIVESYKENINGLKFGTPSFSYVIDNIGLSNVSCYQLDDVSLNQYESISEAASKTIENFENQMFQKYMSLDIFTNNILRSRNEELKELCLAESLILKFNDFGKNIFNTEIEIDNLKLVAFSKKYNNWTEIAHTEEFSISSQVVSFLSENYPLYINESTELSAYNSKIFNVKSLKNKI